MNPEEIYELAQLQLSREYLEEYATKLREKFPGELPDLPEIVNQSLIDTESRAPEENTELHKQYSRDKIAAYTQYLKDAVEKNAKYAAYVRPLLLASSEFPGISRNLGDYFGRLSERDQTSAYVQLESENGLCFYWTHPEQAALFSEMLEAHGFPPCLVQQEPLPADYDYGEAYRTSQTCLVTVPHRYIERLLALAKFHPYFHEQCIRDLYAGKANRASCLVKEAKLSVSNVNNLPVTISQITRGSLDAETDIVGVTICAHPSIDNPPVTPHLIFGLDDSGSMGEMHGRPTGRIEAMNAAIRRLIDTLSDDTEISIQSMNKKTLANKSKISLLREKSNDLILTANGGTPLQSLIASLAFFYRAHPLDPLISLKEFRRTIALIFTDGDADHNERAFNELLPRLQKSEKISASTQVFSKLSTKAGFEKLNISFGMQDFPCQLLPMVVGFSIGTAGDTPFMQALARLFATHQGYIRTDGDMASDMDEVVEFANTLQGQLDRVELCVSSPTSAEIKTLYNLLYGYERTVFYKVPKGEPISLALVHGEKAIKYHDLPFREMNEETKKIFIHGELYEIQSAYEKHMEQMKKEYTAFVIPSDMELFDYETMSYETTVRVPGTRGQTQKAVEKRIKTKADYDVELAQATRESEKQIIQQRWEEQNLKLSAAQDANQKDEKIAIARALHQEKMGALEQKHKEFIQTLINTITCLLAGSDSEDKEALGQAVTILQNIQSSLSFSNATTTLRSMDRHRQAQLDQSLYLGSRSLNTMKAADALLNQSFSKSDIFILLKDNPTEAFEQLKNTPALLIESNVFGSVLHHIFHWATEGVNTEPYRNFLREAIPLNPQALLIGDWQNNRTIAHSAACGTDFDILKIILEAATQAQILPSLLRIRNNQQNATTNTTFGETVLDNIRFSSHFDSDKKREILHRIKQQLNLKDIDLATGNNTLMQALTKLRLAVQNGHSSSEEKRKAILRRFDNFSRIDYLYDASFNGNTALHFACFNAEHAIAIKILQTAKSHGDEVLREVLAACNNHNERPHQNLHLSFDLAESKESLSQEAIKWLTYGVKQSYISEELLPNNKVLLEALNDLLPHLSDEEKDTVTKLIAAWQEIILFEELYEEMQDILRKDLISSSSNNENYTDIKNLARDISQALSDVLPDGVLPINIVVTTAFGPAISADELAEKQQSFNQEYPATIHYTSAVLEEFKLILSAADLRAKEAGKCPVLGSRIRNPYFAEKSYIDIPEDLDTATESELPRLLQILARLEKDNVTGWMNQTQYGNVFTYKEIAMLHALVGLTQVSALITAEYRGGFGGSHPTQLTPPRPVLVIDHAGKQFQKDFKDNGCIAFYPDDPTHRALPDDYVQFQNRLYEIEIAEARPYEPSANSRRAIWHSASGKQGDNIYAAPRISCEGYFDCTLYSKMMANDFLQSLHIAAEASKKIGRNIDFRYLKAGMGFFAEDIQFPDSHRKVVLNLARLEGILVGLRYLNTLSLQERREFLENIDRLELPFSHSFELNEYEDNYEASFEENQQLQIYLRDIEYSAKKLGLKVDSLGESCDALAPSVEDHVTASTNCGDQYAGPGNEGYHQSVDPMIYGNLNQNERIALYAHVNKGMCAAKIATYSFTEISAEMNIFEQLQAIETEKEFRGLENRIKQDPQLLFNRDQFGGTLLHALIYFIDITENQDKKSNYQQLFSNIISLNPETLCQVNVAGSTIAHAAAYRKCFKQLLEIIDVARSTGKLSQLLSVRNEHDESFLNNACQQLDSEQYALLTQKVNNDYEDDIAVVVQTAQNAESIEDVLKEIAELLLQEPDTVSAGLFSSITHSKFKKDFLRVLLDQLKPENNANYSYSKESPKWFRQLLDTSLSNAAIKHNIRPENFIRKIDDGKRTSELYHLLVDCSKADSPQDLLPRFKAMRDRLGTQPTSAPALTNVSSVSREQPPRQSSGWRNFTVFTPFSGKTPGNKPPGADFK